MSRPPDGTREHLDTEIVQWIAYERDAVWAAKLAILRLERKEDIAQFGTWLREHDMHAGELEEVLRAVRPGLLMPREPCFVTRDPHVIGALHDGDGVLDAMIDLEAIRISRYESRRPGDDDGAYRVLDALLARHAADARGRLAWLRERRCVSSVSGRAA